MLEKMVTELNGIQVSALGPQGLRELFSGMGNLRSAVDALEVKATAAMTALGTRRSATAQVLRETTGCSQRQARRQANRAETLSKMPKVTSALADGAITPKHADAFVKAAKQTSAAIVDDDSALLAEAARLPADLAAARTAQWTRRHQSPDDIGHRGTNNGNRHEHTSTRYQEANKGHGDTSNGHSGTIGSDGLALPALNGSAQAEPAAEPAVSYLSNGEP